MWFANVIYTDGSQHHGVIDALTDLETRPMRWLQIRRVHNETEDI